mgnify:CR=1 FL=1
MAVPLGALGLDSAVMPPTPFLPHHALVTAPGASPARYLLMLHGILGSGANLRSFARRLAQAHPGWGFVLVDLRMHGLSQGAPPPHTVRSAAEDLLRLGARLGLSIDGVLGHSFGGKVALEVLRQAGSAAGPLPLEHVVTLDSNPGVREPPRSGDSAVAIIELLGSLPPTFPSRAAFVDAVVGHGRSRALAQWLAMSTEPLPGGGVRFALDLGEIRALIGDYFASDLWTTVAAPPGAARVHLVIAERATSYSAEDTARARELAQSSERVTVDLLPTDHWIHAEDPEGVLRVLLARIP